jgi:uncharacterized phage infection (PIP) family protein YhgE
MPMGMFDIFKGRRAKESAIPVSSEVEDQTKQLGDFANAEGQPVVGGQVPGAAPGFNVQGMSATDGLAVLSQLGPMIQQAMKTGNVQVSQMPPQVIDMRGTGLREEILGIMGQHGISTDGSSGETVNAANYGEMQKQIAAALEKHGIPTAPTSANMGDYGDMQKELMDVLEKHGWHDGMPPGTTLPGTTPPQVEGGSTESSGS